MNAMNRSLTAGTMMALTLCASSALYAAPGKGPEGLKMGPAARMAKQLELTEEQQGKMKALHEGMQTKHMLLGAQKAVKEAELKVLWLAEKPDKKAIMAKHGEMQEIQRQLTEDRVDVQLAVHGMLTPEQRVKFGRHCAMMGGKGMGRQGRQGRLGRAGRQGRKGRGAGMAGPQQRGAKGPMGFQGFHGGPGWQHGARGQGQWQERMERMGKGERGQRRFRRPFEGTRHQVAPAEAADDDEEVDEDEDDK